MSEAEIQRLFEARVTRTWDWTQTRRGSLDIVRQTVLDVAAGRADDAVLDEVTRRVAGSEAAALTLAGQCRAVIRDGKGEP